MSGDSAVICSDVEALQVLVGSKIDALAHSSAKDSAQLNADILRELTQLRAKHRELEAYAEELDRSGRIWFQQQVYSGADLLKDS